MEPNVNDINYNNVKLYMFYRYCLAVGEEKTRLAAGYAVQYLQQSEIGEYGKKYLVDKFFHEAHPKPTQMQLIHYYLHPAVNLTINHISEIAEVTPMTLHKWKEMTYTPFQFDYNYKNRQGLDELSASLEIMEEKLYKNEFRFYSGYTPIARRQLK